MKRILFVFFFAFLVVPVFAQSYVYSKPFIKKKSYKVQGINVPLHQVLVVGDRVHVWEYGGKELVLTVCDATLNPVRELVLPEPVTPGVHQLSFVQLPGFYYLFVTRVNAVAVYRCDAEGSAEPVTERLQQRLGRSFGAQEFTVYPAGNKLFLVQASGGTANSTEYSVYLLDSLLEITHHQWVTVPDSALNVAFDALNDSVFVIKQIAQVAGQSSSLAVSKVNMINGAMKHIRLASEDSYFLNSLTFPGQGGEMLLLNELMLFRSEEQGGLQTRYSYLAAVDQDGKVHHTRALSSPALDDSLKLDGMGFMNMYTGYTPDRKVLHVDFGASVREPYHLQANNTGGRSFGASHLRVSVLDPALDTMRSVYQRFPPGLFPVLRTTESKRLMFFCSDWQSKSQSVSWGYEVKGNGFQEFDLKLNPQYRYFFEAAQPFGTDSFVLPYLDKDFGLVLIRMNDLKYRKGKLTPKLKDQP